MDKGNKKKNKQHKNRNKNAVEFVLANREQDDPNYNNPEANKKVLLQVNKDEDLTKQQKELIKEIPEMQRGVFDEEAKLRKLLGDGEKKDENNSENKKGVKFDFDKNEIIKFDKKKKINEVQKEQKEDKKNDENENQNEEENIETNHPMQFKELDDIDKLNEIFKRVKVNAKMVEYNEYGLRKDIDPELLKFVTNKEFNEDVDIYVPAKVDPNDNNKIIKDFDTDMKEETMNEEFKELEKELKSDSENNNDEEKEKEKNEKKEDEDINTNSNGKDEKNDEKNIKEEIEIKGDLEDDFVLLANGGELPVEFLNDKEIKEKEEKENKKNVNEFDNVVSLTGKPSYKYITPEEVEYVRKKFLENDKKKSQKNNGGKFISKSEFNDALNEILNSQQNKNKSKYEKNTIMGLKKSIMDEDEFEEYELTDEEEEKEEKKNKNEKINDKKEDEEEEEEEEEGEEFHPDIKIEYVSKEDEPDPFEKDKNKIKKKQKNKKEMKKSKTKQYEQLKAMGELSDESFDKEKLNEIILEPELVEKNKEMLENGTQEKTDEEINKEIETKFIFEPKTQKDITQINDKVKNLPKSVKQVNKEREYKKNKKENEKNEEEKEEKEEKGNELNVIKKDETKEEKKLRQKLVKMERKEKRAEKKKLKNAFKEEKVAQQKQIAQSNKIVRYGLSVKDI